MTNEYLNWFKNNRIIGGFLALGITVIAIGNLTDAIGKVDSFLKESLFPDNDINKVFIERKTILENENDTYAVDVIISNNNDKSVWIKGVTIIATGGTNMVCNPNPIATFHYNASLEISNDKVKGKVGSNKQHLSLPGKGYYEHKYCEGLLIFDYEQTLKIPANDKLSYILEITEISLKMTNVTSSRLMPKDPIPRLGYSSEQVLIMSKLGMWPAEKKRSPKLFFSGSSPSYNLPIWRGLDFVFHTDTGEAFSNREKNSGWAEGYYGERINIALSHINADESKRQNIMLALKKRPNK